jgi:hypothetical protein
MEFCPFQRLRLLLTALKVRQSQAKLGEELGRSISRREADRHTGTMQLNFQPVNARTVTFLCAGPSEHPLMDREPPIGFNSCNVPIATASRRKGLSRAGRLTARVAAQ